MTTYAVAPSRSNGWWGMVLFVTGESALFLMLFASYFYLRLQSHHWPPPGVAKPEVLTPTLLTAALVCTSFAMQKAWNAARSSERARAWWWLAAAGVVQGGYLIWQMHDFIVELHASPPSHSAYSSIFFTMLGADHAHVFAGILFTGFLLLRFATRITPYRLRAMQAITFYWHAVNVITVAVLAVSLSPYL